MSKAHRHAESSKDIALDEDDDYVGIGMDEKHNKPVDDETEKRIDEAACTQVISVRMQKSMVADLKLIAELSGGIGYQTLMKQILQRFIEAEMKMYFRRFANEKISDSQKSDPGKPPRRRKTA